MEKFKSYVKGLPIIVKLTQLFFIISIVLFMDAIIRKDTYALSQAFLSLEVISVIAVPCAMLYETFEIMFFNIVLMNIIFLTLVFI